jgi:hypothetical protein
MRDSPPWLDKLMRKYGNYIENEEKLDNQIKKFFAHLQNAQNSIKWNKLIKNLIVCKIIKFKDKVVNILKKEIKKILREIVDSDHAICLRLKQSFRN